MGGVTMFALLWINAGGRAVHEGCCNPLRHCEPPGRREAPPDDRLREAIQGREEDSGLLRFARNDGLTPSPWTNGFRARRFRRHGMTRESTMTLLLSVPLLISVLLPPERVLQFRLCPLQPVALGLR